MFVQGWLLILNWGVRLTVSVALVTESLGSRCAADESAAELRVSPIEYLPVATELLSETQDVIGIAISASGQSPGSKLFVALHDGSVLEVDRQTRKPTRKLSFGASAASQFCISPRGSLIGIVSENGGTVFWDIAAEKRVVPPDFADDQVTAVAMSDNDQAAFACVGGKVKVCEFNPDAEVLVLEGHQATCRAVAFSPDGRSLASADDDGLVKLWDVAKQMELRTLNAHNSRVRGLVYSPDGTWLASGGEDGLVKVCNLNESTLGPIVYSNLAMVWSLEFSPDSSLLAVGDANGAIVVQSLDGSGRTSELVGHGDSITAIEFTPDGQTILSSSYDGRVNEWRAQQPAFPAAATIHVNAGKMWAISTSPIQNHVVVAGKGGFVQIFDLATGESVMQAPEHNTATVDCVQYSPDGTLIATAGWRSPEIRIRNASDLVSIRKLDSESNVRAISFSPDGSKLAAGTEGCLLIVWDAQSGDELHRVTAHSLPVYDVSYSPDGKMLATCSGNWSEAKPGVVKLWAVESMSEITRFKGHVTAVRTAVFNPDSTRLASVSEDGIIKVWDVASQTEIATLKNSTGSRDLVWHPHGKLLAAGLHDGTTNIWDVDSKRVVRRFAGSDDTFCVRYTADASVLCAVGGEKELTLWDTSSTVEDNSQDLTIQSVQKWAEEQP